MDIEKAFSFSIKTHSYGEVTFKCLSIEMVSELEKIIESSSDYELLNKLIELTLKKLNDKKIEMGKLGGLKLKEDEINTFLEKTIKMNFIDGRNPIIGETWFDVLRELIKKQKEKMIGTISDLQKELHFSLPDFKNINIQAFSILSEQAKAFTLPKQEIPKFVDFEPPNLKLERSMLNYLKDLSENINKQNELVAYANNLTIEGINKNIDFQQENNRETKRQSKIAITFSFISIGIAIFTLLFQIYFTGMKGSQEIKQFEDIILLMTEHISLQEKSNENEKEIIKLLLNEKNMAYLQNGMMEVEETSKE